MTPVGKPQDLLTWTVGPDQSGLRLDKLVADIVPDWSRSFAARLIRNGQVLVNRLPSKPGYRPAPGDIVTAPRDSGRDDNAGRLAPEPLDIDTVFIDSSVIVVNKPPGMVVHPGAGHPGGTLANALLYHFPELPKTGDQPDRPGIIHRLDKDTSGLLLIARTEAAAKNLSSQFKHRHVGKTYYALVHGNPVQDEGRILLSIYRHPVHRKKMAAGPPERNAQARCAQTSWKVLERYQGACLLECGIKTGRTHQIRVHLSSSGHPVIGDRVYCRRDPRRMFPRLPEAAAEISQVSRQMLHAGKIRFLHPQTGEELSFTSPLPPDMEELRNFLRSLKE